MPSGGVRSYAIVNESVSAIRFESLVATDSSPPAAPCGICLQTLSEFAGDPAALRIVLVNPAGERRELSLAELLPHGFRREQLTTRDGD